MRRCNNQKEEDESSDDSFVLVDGGAAAPPVAPSPVLAQPTSTAPSSPVAQEPAAPAAASSTIAAAPITTTPTALPTTATAPSPKEKLQRSISKGPIATSSPSSGAEDTTIGTNPMRRRTRARSTASPAAAVAAAVVNPRASASWTKTVSKLVVFALLMTCLRLQWSGSKRAAESKNTIQSKKTPHPPTRPERRKNAKNLRTIQSKKTPPPTRPPERKNATVTKYEQVIEFKYEQVIEHPQLASFVATHTYVLVVKKEVYPQNQWPSGIISNWRSFIGPIPVVVAKLDCEKPFHTTNYAICRSYLRFWWYEHGQNIDNCGGNNLAGFVRAMLVLSRDEATRKAVANLSNGRVRLPHVENFTNETASERKRIDKLRREVRPKGVLDDGDEWAIKAQEQGTGSGVLRYIVNETAFGSFLFENTKQAFVLFCYGGGRLCEPGSVRQTMEQEKIRQLVSVMPYAKVSCDVTPRLCLEQNITAYPTLRSYIKGTAESSELKGTNGIPEIVSWVSRHSKLDQFFTIDFNDTEVFVVSPSNISSFVREHKYVFFYVHEEGFSSAAVEQLLYEFSKRVSRFPLIVAKLSVPSSSMEDFPPAPFVNRHGNIFTDVWRFEERKTWSWLNVVGPSGRTIYFHSDSRGLLRTVDLVPDIEAYVDYVQYKSGSPEAIGITKEQVKEEEINISELYRESIRHPLDGPDGGVWEPLFRRWRRPGPTTPSVQVPLNLTLEQFYLGATFETNHTRQVLCLQWEMCLTQAPDCIGRGIRSIHPQITMRSDSSCVSRGKRWTPNCSSCSQKTAPRTIELTVEVAPGLRAGDNITFTGVMDERLGFTAGDLHFILYEEAHAQYHRDRDDLYKTMEAPLVDALTGFSVTLTHLDGKEFLVQVTTVTDGDHAMRVPGKGMPRRNGTGFGDLYLTFEVDFPIDELNSPENKGAS